MFSSFPYYDLSTKLDGVFRLNQATRPTHRRTDANLYPLGRQLTKASELSSNLEVGQHQKIPSP